MSKTEGKMILISDDDTMDHRVKASLRTFDAMLGCIRTTAHTSKTPLNSFQFDGGHALDLTPIPREEEEVCLSDFSCNLVLMIMNYV